MSFPLFKELGRYLSDCLSSHVWTTDEIPDMHKITENDLRRLWDARGREDIAKIGRLGIDPIPLVTVIAIIKANDQSDGGLDLVLPRPQSSSGGVSGSTPSEVIN